MNTTTQSPAPVLDYGKERRRARLSGRDRDHARRDRQLETPRRKAGRRWPEVVEIW
jgi:hypothetical protein